MAKRAKTAQVSEPTSNNATVALDNIRIRLISNKYDLLFFFLQPYSRLSGLILHLVRANMFGDHTVRIIQSNTKLEKGKFGDSGRLYPMGQLHSRHIGGVHFRHALETYLLSRQKTRLIAVSPRVQRKRGRSIFVRRARGMDANHVPRSPRAA